MGHWLVEVVGVFRLRCHGSLLGRCRWIPSKEEGASWEGDSFVLWGQHESLYFPGSTNALRAKRGFCVHLPFQTLFFLFSFSLEIPRHLDSNLMPLEMSACFLAVLPGFLVIFTRRVDLNNPVHRHWNWEVTPTSFKDQCWFLISHHMMAVLEMTILVWHTWECSCLPWEGLALGPGALASQRAEGSRCQSPLPSGGMAVGEARSRGLVDEREVNLRLREIVFRESVQSEQRLSPAVPVGGREWGFLPLHSWHFGQTVLCCAGLYTVGWLAAPLASAHRGPVALLRPQLWWLTVSPHGPWPLRHWDGPRWDSGGWAVSGSPTLTCTRAPWRAC